MYSRVLVLPSGSSTLSLHTVMKLPSYITRPSIFFSVRSMSVLHKRTLPPQRERLFKYSLRSMQQGLQHRELGVEADRGRHAGHREHQEQHHEREPRTALVEALEVVERVRLEALARQQHDHAEAAQA